MEVSLRPSQRDRGIHYSGRLTTLGSAREFPLPARNDRFAYSGDGFLHLYMRRSEPRGSFIASHCRVGLYASSANHLLGV